MTVEWVAVGVFAAEVIAEVCNAQFIAFCRSVGDDETARLYVEIIQPEESEHHWMAVELLAVHCTTLELQELAVGAICNTLAIADELRMLAEKTTGLSNIPVS